MAIFIATLRGTQRWSERYPQLPSAKTGKHRAEVKDKCGAAHADTPLADTPTRVPYGSGDLALVGEGELCVDGGGLEESWESRSASLPALRPASPENVLSG